MRLAVLFAFAVSLGAQLVPNPIGNASFFGVGLSDFAVGGQYIGTANVTYTVTIASTGTPDKFSWTATDGGAGSSINITGGTCAALPAGTGWQGLSHGVSVCWLAATGHHVADSWTTIVTANGTAAPETVMQAGVGAVVRSAQAKARESVSLLDFGADASGVTCTDAAMQNAANYLTLVGGILYAPPGTYKMCATVNFVSLSKATFTGSGDTTLFVWAGNTSTPMFNWQGNYDSEIGHFQIAASAAFNLAAGIQIQQGVHTSQGNKVSWVFMNDNGYITDGILGNVGSNASNNDFVDVDHCRLPGVIHPVNMSSGGQQYSWHFHDNFFGNFGTTTAGILVTPYMGFCGSFTSERDNFATAPGGWLVDIGGGASCVTATYPDIIDNTDSETHGGFVRMKGGWNQLSIRGGRWVNSLGTGDVQIFDIEGGQQISVTDAQLVISGSYKATMVLNPGGTYGILYNGAYFHNTVLYSTTMTMQQLLGAGINMPDSLGLQFSEPLGWVGFIYPQEFDGVTVNVANGGTTFTVTGATLDTSGAWTANGIWPGLQTCDPTCRIYPFTVTSSTVGTFTYVSAYAGTGGATVAATIGYNASSIQFNNLTVKHLHLIDPLTFPFISTAGTITAGGIITGNAGANISGGPINVAATSGVNMSGGNALLWPGEDTVAHLLTSRPCPGAGNVNDGALAVISDGAFEMLQNHILVSGDGGGGYQYLVGCSGAWVVVKSINGYPDTVTSIVAGTGISVSAGPGAITVTNSAPAGTGFTGTKTRTVCTTITGGVPTGCSNVTETYINGQLQ